MCHTNISKCTPLKYRLKQINIQPLDGEGDTSFCQFGGRSILNEYG